MAVAVAVDVVKLIIAGGWNVEEAHDSMRRRRRSIPQHPICINPAAVTCVCLSSSLSFDDSASIYVMVDIPNFVF